jgi:hypothetical protein
MLVPQGSVEFRERQGVSGSSLPVLKMHEPFDWVSLPPFALGYLPLCAEHRVAKRKGRRNYFQRPLESPKT